MTASVRPTRPLTAGPDELPSEAGRAGAGGAFRSAPGIPSTSWVATGAVRVRKPTRILRRCRCRDGAAAHPAGSGPRAAHARPSRPVSLAARRASSTPSRRSSAARTASKRDEQPGWSVVPRRSVGREPMTTNSEVATTCCTPPSSATAQPAGRQDLRSGSSPDPRFRSAPSTTGNAASRSRIRAMTVPNRYPHWATATSRFLSSKCVVHAGPANHSRIRRGSGSPHRAGRRWGLDRSRPG